MSHWARNVRTVPAPDSYRIGEARLGQWFAEQVSTAIADLERHGHRFSALLLDSIFSSDGIHVHPSILAPAVQVVHRAGGVFIADEVQPGFARTGEAMWGFQRHGVVPDLVTIGKPMGNGIPVAAMAARPEVLDLFARETPYFNTFGGNPVSMAAAQAVLDIIEEDGLADHALAVGTKLRSELPRSPSRTHSSATCAAPACTSGSRSSVTRTPKLTTGSGRAHR